MWEKGMREIRPNVRFYRTKIKRLEEAIGDWDKIRDGMEQSRDPESRQTWLMDNITGLGKKAAAHFMRNTGLMSGFNALPIIDVHIHKALEKLNFKHDAYNEAEVSFKELVYLTALPPLLLDACLWCAYADNWDITHSDYDNFGWDTTTVHSNRRHNSEQLRRPDSKPDTNSTDSVGGSGLCGSHGETARYYAKQIVDAIVVGSCNHATCGGCEPGCKGGDKERETSLAAGAGAEVS
jgi:hypothetical protein